MVPAQGTGAQKEARARQCSFRFEDVVFCAQYFTTKGGSRAKMRWDHMAAPKEEQPRISHLGCWHLACGRVLSVPLTELEVLGKWQSCLQRKS